MEVDFLVGTVFSGLSALVVEDVAESGGMVVVTARTRVLETVLVRMLTRLRAELAAVGGAGRCRV